MNSLQSSVLMGLGEYHNVRDEFRAKILALKRNWHVAIGPNATLYFEDLLTI